MKKVYIGSLMAVTGFHDERLVAHTPALLTARNQEEAEARATDMCKQRFPESQGYCLHSIQIADVSTYVLIRDRLPIPTPITPYKMEKNS